MTQRQNDTLTKRHKDTMTGLLGEVTMTWDILEHVERAVQANRINSFSCKELSLKSSQEHSLSLISTHSKIGPK